MLHKTAPNPKGCLNTRKQTKIWYSGQNVHYLETFIFPVTDAFPNQYQHYGDVIMGAIASQITSLTIVLNCLFRRRSNKTPKLRVTGLCAGNSPGTGEFPAQMASNAENVSIWWRHHEISQSQAGPTTARLTVQPPADEGDKGVHFVVSWVFVFAVSSLCFVKYRPILGRDRTCDTTQQ